MTDAQCTDEPTTTAAWMDRLSDRVGSLVPGGGLLPPRHPVKVSLVMGLLGLTAAWFSVGLELLEWFASIFLGLNFEDHLLAGIVFGCAVILPLAVWLRQPWWRAGGSVLVGVLMILIVRHLTRLHHVQMVLRSPMGTPTIMLRHTFASFAGIGFVLGILVGGESPRKNHLAAAVLSGVVLAASLFALTTYRDWVGNNINEFLVWGRYGYWVAISTFKMLDHAIVVCGSAICLGMTLWDSTPRPKFESAGSDALEKPAS